MQVASPLNHSKCQLIPRVITADPETYIKLIREKLSETSPLFATEAAIAHGGKYLGFESGPHAGYASWAAPTAKCWSRVHGLASAVLAPKERLREYASKCLTVFSYVQQLSPPLVKH